MIKRQIFFIDPLQFASMMKIRVMKSVKEDVLELNIQNPDDAPQSFDEAVETITKVVQTGKSVGLICPFNENGPVFASYKAKNPEEAKNPADMLSDMLKEIASPRPIPVLMPFMEIRIKPDELLAELNKHENSTNVLGCLSKYLLNVDKAFDYEKINKNIQDLFISTQRFENMLMKHIV